MHAVNVHELIENVSMNINAIGKKYEFGPILLNITDREDTQVHMPY